MAGTRSALIIANYEYADPGLARLRSPVDDAADLSRVLNDPAIGGFTVRTLRNQPAHLINEAVEEFFADRGRDDFLLLYICGHGLKNERGQLYFAAADTKRHLLGATAVSADFVNRSMEDSRSRSIVLLLDCSYSGAFGRGMSLGGDIPVSRTATPPPRSAVSGSDSGWSETAGANAGVLDQLRGQGRVVITASSAMEYAFEGDALSASPEAPSSSVFTSAVVDGLETGQADLDGDGWISLNDLYQYVHPLVRQAAPQQTPQMSSSNVQGELYIARSARAGAPPVTPDSSRDTARTFSERTGAIAALAFSPDGQTLATGGDDGLLIRDATSGRPLATGTGADSTGVVRALAFHPDGLSLATCGEGAVQMWDAGTGGLLASYTNVGVWRALVYSPGGHRLAAGGDDGVETWDAAAALSFEGFSTTGSPIVTALAYSQSGRTLAVGEDGGAVGLWDQLTAEPLRMLAGLTSRVTSLAYSPDGGMLAAAGYDGTVRLWDASTGEPLRTLTGHTSRVAAVAFSPDGGMLASAGFDGTVRLWDPATGVQVRTLTGHTGRVAAVAYSPDGTLASAGDDGWVRLWPPDAGQPRTPGNDGAPRPPRRPRRALPGLHSDVASAQDLLNNAADVEMLATLAAAMTTRPPLAIALLGKWGAGKSSLMAQMHRQIEQLAQLSTNNPGVSAFAATVRQIHFNAWHYSDEHLWTGLIDHLFRSLAADDNPSAAADAPSAGRAEAERARLAAELAVLESAQRKLDAQLAGADAAARPGGSASWWGSFGEGSQLLFPACRLALRDGWRNRWALAALVVVVAGGYAGRHWLPARIAALAGGVAALAVPAWAAVRRRRAQGTTLVGKLRALLEERRQSLRTEVSVARARLVEMDAAVRLATFLVDHGDSRSYQEYRGLLGQVHHDLVQLDDTLRQAHAQWEGAGTTAPPPLERIVLYIDDLDRCPPKRVVELLAAVHLMLALPLFVVVVAVDPRWLLKSLEHHYQELFTASPGEALDADEGTTPLDYLDKIFQIPFSVPPATAEKAAPYLTALLGAPAPAVSPAAPPPSDPADPAAPPPVRGDTRGDVPPPPPGAGESAGRAAARDRSAVRASDPGTPWAVPDLQPEQLQLQAAEIDFMARLGALTPTPRAAKKLVNLYRLVRIGVDRHDLPHFVGAEPETPGTHQVVQLLLAVLVGSPSDSGRVFGAILRADPTVGIVAVLRSGEVPPAGRQLADLVEEMIGAGTRVLTDTALYQQWCPELARFSFHTRSLVRGLAGPVPESPERPAPPEPSEVAEPPV